MDRTRILVVDDHRLFAEAVAVRLAREPDFHLLPVAYHKAHAKSLIDEHVPDLVLLDLVLEDEESGIDVLDHVRERHPGIRVAMLSALESVDLACEAVRHGATGWLPKTVDGDQLVRAVRGVSRGEGFIPPQILGDLLRRLVAEPAGGPAAILSRLTPRESEVFQCLVDGMSRTEIARHLYLSHGTVRTHTQNLLAKLETHSVLEAVAFGLRAGMRPSRA